MRYAAGQGDFWAHVDNRLADPDDVKEFCGARITGASTST